MVGGGAEFIWVHFCAEIMGSPSNSCPLLAG